MHVADLLDSRLKVFVVDHPYVNSYGMIYTHLDENFFVVSNPVFWDYMGEEVVAILAHEEGHDYHSHPYSDKSKLVMEIEADNYALNKVGKSKLFKAIWKAHIFSISYVLKNEPVFQWVTLFKDVGFGLVRLLNILIK
jgi:hypothetical protein